jgi:hypothetical protein
MCDRGCGCFGVTMLIAFFQWRECKWRSNACHIHELILAYASLSVVMCLGTERSRHPRITRS